MIDLTSVIARIVSDTMRVETRGAVLPPARSLGNIGVGDLLHVTLWQADPTGGTLLDRAALDVNARVDSQGTISVPYAGRLHVAGIAPAAVERNLVARLGEQTVAPQASVLVADNQADSVVVEGEVARPGRVALTDGERRLGDVIALAGGPKLPPYQIAISVSRGGVVHQTSPTSIEADPTQDIALSPGDRIKVSSVERHYYAFGAVNRPGDQAYVSARMTLAEALGHVAGLQDGRANPAGLFVFRRQDAALTRRLLVQQAAPGTDLTQVVYRVNLRDPSSFFIMGQLDIAPRDILYVSNAPLAQIGKFASILAGISSVAATPRNFGAY